jgi:hypothetical protein
MQPVEIPDDDRVHLPSLDVGKHPRVRGSDHTRVRAHVIVDVLADFPPTLTAQLQAVLPLARHSETSSILVFALSKICSSAHTV